MFFRLPVVRFFNRVINRATVTVALVLLQIGWLLWAFFSLTAGKVWVNAGLNVLSLFITLYLVRKDENSDYKIIWLVLIGMMPLLGGALYLAFGPLGRRYRPFANWAMPQWATWRELLRLGVPMGLSNLVEITSFTLISLFIAPLGATVVAGHRIVANLSALTYMLPLSLAIATMAALGQAVGAHDRVRARATIRAGLWLAAGSSSLVGLLLWLAAEPVVNAYTDDPGVRLVAVGLIGYVALYQFFDALQTVAGHCLRAYRVTFVPMLVQTFCFWGIGLLGGGWLCYRAPTPLGVAGFWLASVVSLIFAAGLLLPLLRKALTASESMS